MHELERRHETHRNYSVRFPFSGLLVCSECKQKLHRRLNGNSKTGRRLVLACAEGQSHITVDYEDLVRRVSTDLQRQLEQVNTDPKKEPAEVVDQDEHLIEDLRRRRKQVQEDRQVGIYTQAEAAEQIATLDDQIAKQQQKKDSQHEASLMRDEFRQTIGKRMVYFAEWILDDDPQVVHRLLHALCEKIIIFPDLRIDIHWRT